MLTGFTQESPGFESCVHRHTLHAQLVSALSLAQFMDSVWLFRISLALSCLLMRRMLPSMYVRACAGASGTDDTGDKRVLKASPPPYSVLTAVSVGKGLLQDALWQWLDAQPLHLPHTCEGAQCAGAARCACSWPSRDPLVLTAWLLHLEQVWVCTSLAYAHCIAPLRVHILLPCYLYTLFMRAPLSVASCSQPGFYTWNRYGYIRLHTNLRMLVGVVQCPWATQWCMLAHSCSEFGRAPLHGHAWFLYHSAESLVLCCICTCRLACGAAYSTHPSSSAKASSTRHAPPPPPPHQPRNTHPLLLRLDRAQRVTLTTYPYLL